MIVYELLDEVMDFGLPQFTDPKILKEYANILRFLPILHMWFVHVHICIEIFRYITQESHKLEIQVRPPSTVTNAVSWRSEGIKYRKNEVRLMLVCKLEISTEATEVYP